MLTLPDVPRYAVLIKRTSEGTGSARFKAPGQANVKEATAGAIGTNSAVHAAWVRGWPLRYRGMSPPGGDAHRGARTDTARATGAGGERIVQQAVKGNGKQETGNRKPEMKNE